MPYPSSAENTSREKQAFWVTRHATTILFFIIVLSAAGIYLAGKIPISVFPRHELPPCRHRHRQWRHAGRPDAGHHH